MMSRKLAASLALAVTVLVSDSALADSTGTAGAVIGLEVNATSSDVYATYQGRVFVREDAATVQAYQWQGITCSGHQMTDRQIAVLDATMNTKKAGIIPYWKAGAGGARCIVGFAVTNSVKNIPLIGR